MARSLLLGLLSGGALALALGACGGGRAASRPVANVATTTQASESFGPIREAWSTESKGRGQWKASLQLFLARFPDDGLAPLARTYLALVLLDEKGLSGAEGELAKLGALPEGSTRDLAAVARAKLLRLRGRSDLAFEMLRPLVGKVVDPMSRAILQEEVSLAAIDSRRDYEAIAYMDAWLRNAGDEDRDAVKTKIRDALAKVPEAVLENALRAMRAGGPASGYGREIQRMVTERLGAIALARGDSDLARWLVAGEASAPLLGASEGALGELAITRRGLASVDGRTIGLVLPTGSSDLRDEAAAIMRGVAWALDMPREDPTRGDRTKLATRDDGGDVTRIEPTMSELSGEGAAVILAALDPASADRAVRWGEEHGVAVIVLAAPRENVPRDWAFVAGVTRDAEIGALGEELVSRGVPKLVPIVAPNVAGGGGGESVKALAKGSVEVAPPVLCDTAAAQSGEAHFPIEEWKTQKVRAWIVDAPSECARDLVRELGSAKVTGAIALTLDAEGTTARAPTLKLLAVQAGSIPVMAPTADAVSDPELRAWFQREGTPPSWWSALGHDAGILARRAVAGLPLDATSDGAEVKKRRQAAKDALAAARAPLWTSDAQTFAGAHALARDLRVVELRAPFRE